MEADREAERARVEALEEGAEKQAALAALEKTEAEFEETEKQAAEAKKLAEVLGHVSLMETR